MWLAIIITAVALTIGIAIGVSQGKNAKKLLDEGKIIPRGYKYAEKGEEFTCRIGTMQALHDALDAMNNPCPMEGNTSKLKFKGSSYSAVLYNVAYDEPSGVAIYRFEFTSFKINGARYENDIEMNYLMTAVEKVFLGLDPNTGVKTYELDFKTKHSIF